MYWALGIGVEQNKLVARMLNRNGTQTSAPLESLTSSGIPVNPKEQKKPGLVTEFRTWRKINPKEYLAAFNIEISEEVESNHQVYEFQVRDTIVQVPTLVLMRALFLPSKYLMPRMFKPHALEDIGYINSSELQIQADWAQPGYRCMTVAIRNTLRWMFAFPSANEMAHSVHENAIEGAITLALPQVIVRLSVHGKKIKNTYYATELIVSKIVAQELPFTFSSNCPIVVTESSKSLVIAPDDSIPLLNGQVTLSDGEWQMVEPVLLAYGRECTKLCQRNLFDTILEKLHSGIPWRKMTYKTGSFVHASRAYRFWQQKGTFQAALNLLKTLRH